MRMQTCDFLIVICAGTEWRTMRPFFPDAQIANSPYGEYFSYPISSNQVTFLHSGWGKIATAGATQFGIERWNPKLLVNLGTCGGVEGLVRLEEVILAEETIVYDIIEGMSSYEEAIRRYSTKADLDWLGARLPFSARRMRLFSADRDIRPEDVGGILKDFGAAAADWESGAFAWVCEKNQRDWLVMRTVSDLVSENKGEALGNAALWRSRTGQVMQTLLNYLPWLLERYQSTH